MSQLTLQQLQMLMTAQGQGTLAAVSDMLASGTAATRRGIDPATVGRLRGWFPAELVSAALTLNSLRVRARERFSKADGMFFDGADLLEQATSEPVARHKTGRFAGFEIVADLCCGAGGDAVAIAERTGKVIGVDLSLARLVCLRANAENAGVRERVWPVASDVNVWLPMAQAYHIDPPRRDGGTRQLRGSQWSEWIGRVEALAQSHGHVAGKFSPAIDVDQLGWAGEIEFISENGTLKQAVTWSGSLARQRRSATVIRSLHGMTLSQETLASDSPVRAAQVTHGLQAGLILHEPDAAVVRAGLLGNLAEQLGAGLVDPHLPLLITQQPGSSTLLARQYEVLEVASWSARKVKLLLRERGYRVAEVKTRAFAGRPEEILAGLKGLKSPADGPAVVLWAVRLGSKPMCILTRRVAEADESRKGLSHSDL